MKSINKKERKLFVSYQFIQSAFAHGFGDGIFSMDGNIDDEAIQLIRDCILKEKPEYQTVVILNIFELEDKNEDADD